MLNHINIMLNHDILNQDKQSNWIKITQIYTKPKMIEDIIWNPPKCRPSHVFNNRFLHSSLQIWNKSWTKLVPKTCIFSSILIKNDSNQEMIRLFLIHGNKIIWDS